MAEKAVERLRKPEGGAVRMGVLTVGIKSS
jgi:hypothetical protein